MQHGFRIIEVDIKQLAILHIVHSFVKQKVSYLFFEVWRLFISIKAAKINNRASSLYLKALRKLSFSFIVNMLHRFYSLILCAVSSYAFFGVKAPLGVKSTSFSTCAASTSASTSTKFELGRYA